MVYLYKCDPPHIAISEAVAGDQDTVHVCKGQAAFTLISDARSVTAPLISPRQLLSSLFYNLINVSHTAHRESGDHVGHGEKTYTEWNFTVGTRWKALRREHLSPQSKEGDT